jgi:Rhs element Vgr protein
MAQQPTPRVARKVLINGKPLSNEVSVMSVSVLCYFNKIATAKLKIQDGSAAKRDFLQSNTDLFKPGNEVEIQLGYDENPSTVFKGIIIRHCIKVKGGSFLEVEAKDKAVKMTQIRKSAYFIDLNDKAIIDQLAEKYSLDKDVDATEKEHSQMVQYYCSDWDFMLLRAEANGMFVLTDNGKLVVKKPVLTGTSVLTATYGDNIVEFEGEMDARRQFVGMHASAWDYDRQKVHPDPATDGASSLTENGNFGSSDLAKVLGNTLELKHSGDIPDDQLKNWGDAWAMRNHLSKTSGRIKIRGNQNLKAGQKITLAGVGDRFNGEVYVTGILHQFDGEFTTDIQFGWAEDWFYKHDDIIEKPASGLVPGVTGLQIATVKQLEGAPAGKTNHIKVNLPMIQSSVDGIWARVAIPDAGSGRGFIFRPEIGDEVLLGFINDDPRDAVILGMLHSKAKAPPEILPASDSNHKKGIVSREGMKIVFDDESKILTIAVPVSAGGPEKSIVIDNKAGSIELKDELKNSIKMDKKGITIDSGGIVTIKGTKINLN